MTLANKQKYEFLTYFQGDLKKVYSELKNHKIIPNAGKNHLIFLVLRFGNDLKACDMEIQPEVIGAFSSRKGVERLYTSGISEIQKTLNKLKATVKKA